MRERAGGGGAPGGGMLVPGDTGGGGVMTGGCSGGGGAPTGGCADSIVPAAAPQLLQKAESWSIAAPQFWQKESGGGTAGGGGMGSGCGGAATGSTTGSATGSGTTVATGSGAGAAAGNRTPHAQQKSESAALSLPHCGHLTIPPHPQRQGSEVRRRAATPVFVRCRLM